MPVFFAVGTRQDGPKTGAAPTTRGHVPIYSCFPEIVDTICEPDMVTGVRLSGRASRDSPEPAAAKACRKDSGHHGMPEKLRTPQAPA
jgi:hypothetical protein